MLWFSSRVFLTVWKWLMLILNICSTVIVQVLLPIICKLTYKKVAHKKRVQLLELSLLSTSPDCRLCTCSHFPHLPCSELTSPDHLFTRISSALQPCGRFTVPWFILVARLPSCFFFLLLSLCVSVNHQNYPAYLLVYPESHTPWQIQYYGFVLHAWTGVQSSNKKRQHERRL